MKSSHFIGDLRKGKIKLDWNGLVVNFNHWVFVVTRNRQFQSPVSVILVFFFLGESMVGFVLKLPSDSVWSFDGVELIHMQFVTATFFQVLDQVSGDMVLQVSLELSRVLVGGWLDLVQVIVTFFHNERWVVVKTTVEVVKIVVPCFVSDES